LHHKKKKESPTRTEPSRTFRINNNHHQIKTSASTKKKFKDLAASIPSLSHNLQKTNKIIKKSKDLKELADPREVSRAKQLSDKLKQTELRQINAKT